VKWLHEMDRINREQTGLGLLGMFLTFVGFCLFCLLMSLL
jgi:hypothetical protein